VKAMTGPAFFSRGSSRVLGWIVAGGFFALAGSMLLYLAMSLTSKIEPELLVIYAGVAAVLLLLAFASLSFTKARAYSADAVIFSVLRVLWMFLLIDDIIFNFGRHNALSSALQGNFTSAAYGEVLLWVLAAAILAVV